MKIVGQWGEKIDWHLSVEPPLQEALDQWRRYAEMKLAMPIGFISAVQWDESGEVRLIVDRSKLPLL